MATQRKIAITVTVSETVHGLLEVLVPQTVNGVELSPETRVAAAVEQLLDHAQQGVYRPGAWERGWLCQAFGDDWLERLEVGDPYGRANSPMFNRPRKAGKEVVKL